MPKLHGAPSRADSFLQKLRDHVHGLLDHDIPAAQILDATASEARRLLPAIASGDADRIADFIIEEVCDDRSRRQVRLRRGGAHADETDACRIIAFRPITSVGDE